MRMFIKKCLMVLCVSFGLSCVAAGLVGYAGRNTVTYTTTASLGHPNTTPGVQLSSLTVKFGTPTNLTFYVSTVLANVTNLAYKVTVTASDSVVISSTGLWFAPADRLILSNSTPVTTTAQADYTY